MHSPLQCVGMLIAHHHEDVQAVVGAALMFEGGACMPRLARTLGLVPEGTVLLAAALKEHVTSQCREHFLTVVESVLVCSALSSL